MERTGMQKYILQKIYWIWVKGNQWLATDFMKEV